MYKDNIMVNMNKDKEIALSQLKKGNSGVVRRLITTDGKNLQKLLAMGILPGRIIHVIRTSPVFILQIDNTQAAMDKELAQNIMLTINSH